LNNAPMITTAAPIPYAKFIAFLLNNAIIVIFKI
jgi:hypothetical protein